MEIQRATVPSRPTTGALTPDCGSFQKGLSRRTSLLSPEASRSQTDTIWDWDQPGDGPSRGWRKHAQEGNWSEARRQICEVLDAHPPSRWPSKLGRHVVAFHGLQMAAFSGCARQELESLASQALSEGDGKWNDYVEATRCFMVGDRSGLSAILPRCHDNPNGPVILRLAQNFGKPYLQVYSAVSEMQSRA
jgi:hypothetical protein